MAENRKPKKIIPGRSAPKADTPASSSVIFKPSIENLLNDTLQIIAVEVARYRGKVERGMPLDFKEARIVQGFAKNLKDLSEEARAHKNDQPLHHLNDEELIQLLQGDADVEVKDGKITINNKNVESDEG